MKNLIIATVFTLFCTGSISGQSIEIDETAQQELEKLSFIIGEWEWEWEWDGWMMGRDGTKHLFTQSETVQFKLDKTAILIEGMGKSGGEIIHNALAVVRFNQQQGNYLFNSYLSTGQNGEFEAEMITNKFHWYPSGNTRYVIELNESGEWFETGEINQNGTWVQFFEMTLKKV